MAKICFCPVVIQTFARLDAAAALLETVDEAVLLINSQRQAHLSQRAQIESWEPGEYFVERDALNSTFLDWLPAFSTYSVIVLLHSIRETHLAALAN